MTPVQIKDRIRAITIYISNFIERENQNIECDIQSSATNIVNLYNDYIEEFVRPSITSGIVQNYKIISNTELAVLRVSPLSVGNDENIEKYYNSKLALEIALNILLEWNNGLDENKCRDIFKSDNEIRSFLEEHLNWLYLLKPIYYYPAFSNSQVWRLFYYLLRDKTKQSQG
jgi:hypothetical protein